MEDDLKKLAAGFVNAAKIAAPSSYIPEISNFARAGAISDIVKQGISGAGALAGQRAKEADDADEAARKAKIQALSDQADPSKYYKQRKADGGFAFYDPSGKEIDLNTFAQRTGERRVDVLKDSENPLDQQYINDWNNANTLAQAIYNNDTTTMQSIISQNPDLKSKNPQDFMSELIRKYPHMYGRGSYQQSMNNRGMKLFNDNGMGAGGMSLSGLGG